MSHLKCLTKHTQIISNFNICSRNPDQMEYLLCSRGAIECIGSLGGGKPRETLSTEAVHRLKTACETLGECASGFMKLNYGEHASEAHVEHAQGLRLVRSDSTPEC